MSFSNRPNPSERSTSNMSLDPPNKRRAVDDDDEPVPVFRDRRAVSVLSMVSSTPRMRERTGGSEVLTWGSNETGESGLQISSGDIKSPTSIPNLRNHSVVKAVAGGEHTLCLGVDSSVYGFGAGFSTEEEVIRQVQGLDSVKVVDVACGEEHSLLLLEGGTAMAMGRNDYGQLGTGDDETRSLTKVRRVKQLDGIVRIACGGRHSLVVTMFGAVYSWGNNMHYQLGHGDNVNRKAPTKVTTLWGLPAADVCAGGNHSMALLHTGAVLAWGRAKKGQCGLGVQQDVQNPTELTELSRKGTHIVAIVAGGDHSGAIDRNGDVYMWGCAMEGASSQQLPGKVDALQGKCARMMACGSGHQFICVVGDKSVVQWSCRLPVHVERVPVATGQSVDPSIYPVVVNVSCGSSHNVLLTELDDDDGAIARETAGTMVQKTSVFEVNTARIMCRQAQDSREYRSIMDYLMLGFGCAAVLNSCALPEDYLLAVRSEPDLGIRKCISPHAPPVKYDAVCGLYESVFAMGSDRVATLLDAARIMLLKSAHEFQREDVHADALRALYIIALFPFCRTDVDSTSLFCAFCDVFYNFPSRSRSILIAWFADMPSELLGDIVIAIHRLVGVCMEEKKQRTLLGSIALLEILYESNEYFRDRATGAYPLKISFTQFYNDSVSSKLDAAADYIGWLRSKSQPAVKDPTFYLSGHPFILDVAAKYRLLRTESVVLQQKSMESSVLSAVMSGQNVIVPYFVCNVRRDHIVSDTFRCIEAISNPEHRSREMKKPMRVIFDGEEGIDEGGVRKEYFLLIVKELFDPKYGMFVDAEDGITQWFNRNSLGSSDEYEIIGAVLGLAIYNGVILDLKFPPVVYKKITNQQPTLRDLADIYPSLAHGLRELLNYDGDVENDLCQSFQITYDYYGETQVVDLCPDGGNVTVTNYNRESYVAAYVDWYLTKSVQEQFDAFRRGFLSVVDGYAIHFFRYEELELMICGNPDLNMRDLEKVCTYDGGYSADHPTIKSFWEVVHRFNAQQQRDFLMFATGSYRVPVKGLGAMNFKIQRAGPDSDGLPTSHTCFNVLVLPEYSSQEKMESKLLTAINWSTGFGLM